MTFAFPMPSGKATLPGLGEKLLIKKVEVFPGKDAISEASALAVVLLSGKHA